MNDFHRSLARAIRTYRLRSSEWLARKSVDWATLSAQRRLRDFEKMPSMLVDSDVIRNGVTHTNAWVSTGEVMWGNSVPMTQGFRARVPRAATETRASEINYLVGIARLASLGLIETCTSRQLRNELWRHPMRAEVGDSMGVSIFAALSLRNLDMPRPYSSTSNLDEMFPSEARQIEQLQMIQDPEWVEINRIIGPAHTLDAFHFWTAHRHNIDYFLTMENRFPNHIRTLRKQKKLDWINVSLVRPSEFGKIIGLRPVDYRVVGLIDRPFPDLVIFDRK